MPLQATYCQYVLDFKKPSGTSRGVLQQKETWFIKLQNGAKVGYGECGILRGLSYDDVPNYETQLRWVCENIHLGLEVLWNACLNFPSIQFGLEQAFRSIGSDDPFILYESPFTKGQDSIEINGLIWMGAADKMKSQIQEKLKEGVSCVKLKVGALDFESEVSLLSFLRLEAPHIEIRLDANGGFQPNEVFEKLQILSQFNIHSIEQPVSPKHKETLTQLCTNSPIDIALDESLIGILEKQEKESLLKSILPQYIILKPSFIGGFQGSLEWIDIANSLNIGWWITSALESNIGLNAIAQWTYTLGSKMPQGLGTGSLFTNNIKSPLYQKNGYLSYLPSEGWELEKLYKTCI